MPKTFALFIAIAALAACTSTNPMPQPAGATPVAAPPPPATAPPPPPPDRSCKELQRDAYAIVSAHNTCKVGADCAPSSAACPSAFACGRLVNAKEVDQVNAELRPLSERFEAQCGQCASDAVRCAKPNAVCRDGRCAHEPLESTCDQLEADAEALIQKHNACETDSDCVFARDSGACPQAFACGVTVNKAEEQPFAAQAAPLSRAFHAYCGRCMVEVAHCSVTIPICEAGRCSRRRMTHPEELTPEQRCARLEDIARDLLSKHNHCTTSDDCVHARDGIECLESFMCGVAVHRAEERDFYERASTLANLYRDECKKCNSGECGGERTPTCDGGRCMLQPTLHRHPRKTPL